MMDADSTVEAALMSSPFDVFTARVFTARFTLRLVAAYETQYERVG